MMEKPAELHYPIHDLLRRRWSPRAFSDRAVSHDVLCTLMEAARWAPSSSNEQPWNFLIATKEIRGEYDRLLSCLNESNQVWARLAPVLAISIARTVFADEGEPNRHALHDVGLCVENLVIQATSVELMVHQMAGFSPDKARELFELPADYEAVAAIAIGYPGDPSLLPDRLRQRELAPRSRKPITDFVFTGRWGHQSPIVTSLTRKEKR
jgi:nitroreductase